MNHKLAITKARFVFGVLLVGLALSSCGGAPSQQNTDAAQQDGPLVAGIAKLDSCALLTKADAEALLGEPVGEPSRNDVGSEVTEDERAVSNCAYSTKGDNFKMVSVLVRRDVSGAKGTDSLEQIRSSAESKTTYTPVAGLGEAALWSEGELGHQLTVAQGRYLLIASAQLDDEAPTLDLSKSVAERVLARLP